MVNAASELADLLEQWNVRGPNKTGYIARNGENGPGDAEDWRRQIRAVQLLHDVDVALSAMEQLDGPGNPYRESFEAWAFGVFEPERNWSGGPASDELVVPQPDIRLLRALGEQIESRMPTPIFEPAARDATSAAIDDLFDLLADTNLGMDLAGNRYLFELLTTIRTALAEHERFGTVDLRRRINELRGFLDRLADGLDTRDESGLAEQVRLIARRVWPWGQNIALALGWTAQTWAAVKEITS